MFNKHRLEALSDGIFAIAMTLLVFALKVPTEVVHGHLWDALRGDADNWIAFLVTFTISARYWMLQHRVFELSEAFTQQAVVLTFVFLGLITILPFTSALVGRHATESLSVVLYCANQSAIGMALIGKLEYLRLRDRIPKSIELTLLRQRLYILASTMAVAAVCAHFVALRYLLVIPIVSGTVSRTLRRRRNHKHV